MVCQGTSLIPDFPDLEISDNEDDMCEQSASHDVLDIWNGVILRSIELVTSLSGQFSPSHILNCFLLQNVEIYNIWRL